MMNVGITQSVRNKPWVLFFVEVPDPQRTG